MSTERLVIRLVEPDDVCEVIDYDRRNAEHLAPWEPARDAAMYDRDKRRQSLARRRQDADANRGYAFIAKLAGSERIVAMINLSNVVRGAFQACHLGYSVDSEYEGKGIAAEAIAAVVDFAFETLQLHRVMGNYQPRNERSGRLLRRLGFAHEGYARDYLFINGAWRDHVLTSKVK